MVTVIKRPKWSIWKYQEVYKCDIPRGCVAPLEKAAAFYKKRDGALIVEPGRIRVSRNHWYSSLFAFNDLATKHDIIVEVMEDGNERAFRCEYLAFYLYPARHVPPWSFESEVYDLHSSIGNVDSRPRQNSLRLSAAHPIYRLAY